MLKYCLECWPVSGALELLELVLALCTQLSCPAVMQRLESQYERIFKCYERGEARTLHIGSPLSFRVVEVKRG